VYLFYQPDLNYLKATALNLQLAGRLGKDKKKLVFAPIEVSRSGSSQRLQN
jgi:hypothetical protein